MALVRVAESLRRDKIFNSHYYCKKMWLDDKISRMMWQQEHYIETRPRIDKILKCQSIVVYDQPHPF